MKTITLTISITVPDDVEVEVKTEAAQAPIVEDTSLPAPVRVMRSTHLTYPAPVSSYDSRPWTDEEDAIVRDLTYAVADISELIDRSVNAVHNRRYRLGINTSGRVRHIVEASNSMRRWSTEEDEALMVLAAKLPPGRRMFRPDLEPIAQQVGRSVEGVRARILRLRKKSSNESPQES